MAASCKYLISICLEWETCEECRHDVFALRTELEGKRVMKAKAKQATPGSQRTSRNLRQVATKKEKKRQAMPATDVLAPGNISRAVDAVRSGDHQQFDAIFDFLHDRLRNYIRVLQNGSSSAAHGVSDTVSETLLKLFKAILAPTGERILNRRELTGLALRIAQGSSIDAFRQANTLQRGRGLKATVLAETLMANDKEPLEHLMAQEMEAEVRRQIAKIKNDLSRRLLELSLVEGCTLDEIRPRLLDATNGMSDAALERRLKRAKKSMFDVLKKKFPEE